MRRPCAAWVLLLACVGCFTEGSRDAEPEISTAIVSVGEIPPVKLGAGESTTVVVPVIVADGYHVQSNPAASEFLVPLELRIEPGDGVVLGAPAYPPAHPHRLAGSDEDLLTYEGTVPIELSVSVAPSAAPGDRTIEGSLRYQACDSRICFFPASVPVSFKVAVSG